MNGHGSAQALVSIAPLNLSVGRYRLGWLPNVDNTLQTVHFKKPRHLGRSYYIVMSRN